VSGRVDAVVIGAGFGGLGAALTLAAAGRSVVLCEALNYPGGCASTFVRDGYRFEAGATLFSGFSPGQLMHRWIDRFRLPVEVQPLDPVLRFRVGGAELVIPRDRRLFVERIAARSTAPAARIRAFFAWQKRVADPLWQLFDDPSLLPPLGVRQLGRHVRQMGSYAPMLGLLGRSLAEVLRSWELEHCPFLRTYLDAVCQITVQVPAAEAEALFALAAIDYFFRGCVHVRGGVGALATALCGAIEAQGGEVWLSSRVRGLQRRADRWVVQSRRGELSTASVFASSLPGDLSALSGTHSRRLGALQRRVEEGWGAATWYLALRSDVALPPDPVHIQCVADPARPLQQGNHLMCSVSPLGEDRGPEGVRTATVSTHVPMTGDPSAVAMGAQTALRETLRMRAPEVDSAIVHALSGSPRTFARFTRRGRGFVGGIPRRVGLGNYADLFPRPVADGLWLVGDTVFPGQSTLATAIGGQRAAMAWMR